MFVKMGIADGPSPDDFAAAARWVVVLEIRTAQHPSPLNRVRRP
jgi:hypothetical protein